MANSKRLTCSFSIASFIVQRWLGFRGAFCLKALVPRAIDPRSGRSAGKRRRLHGSNLLCPFCPAFPGPRSRSRRAADKILFAAPQVLNTGSKLDKCSVSPKSATNGGGRAWQYSNVGGYRQTANIVDCQRTYVDFLERNRAARHVNYRSPSVSWCQDRDGGIPCKGI